MHRLHRLVALTIALGVVVPAFAQAPATPLVGTANDKVLVQRGQEFLPAVPNMQLQPADRIVVLEGGNLRVTCDGSPFATFNEVGIYPAPQCVTAVASVPPPASAPPPASPQAAAASSAAGTNWATVAAVGGGLVVAAAAVAGGGRDDNPPVSP
jgi:hypothetical protein